MIIDFEHHLFIEGRTTKGRSPSGSIVERYRKPDGDIGVRIFEAASKVEQHLRFMDEAGIDLAVLTTNPEPTTNPELLLERCRKFNNLCARAVKEHPRRFAGFASIPPLGGQPALEELERAVKELGLKGVHIHSRSGKHTLDEKDYWPFYEKVSELKIPMNLHVVTEPQGFDALKAPYPLYYMVAREFDLCATTLRICLGGVLEAFPDLLFIINHFGGGVSSIVERVDAYMGYTGPAWSDFYPGKPPITRPWREYFKKLYFNMAGREQGMDTVNCALTNISPRRMVFGTDWPFNYDNDAKGVKKYVADLRKLPLPAEEIEGMLGGNGARLLGL